MLTMPAKKIQESFMRLYSDIQMRMPELSPLMEG